METKRLLMTSLLTFGIVASLVLSPVLMNNNFNFAMAQSPRAGDVPVPPAAPSDEDVASPELAAEIARGDAEAAAAGASTRSAVSTLASVAAARDGVAREGSPGQFAATWESLLDVLVTPGDASLDAEPDIIASEVNPGVVAAEYSDFSSGGLNRCRLATSTDNTSTWVDKGFMIVPAGTSFHSDPVLATNTRGHFIATCLAFDGDSSAIIMQVSVNNGASYGGFTTVAGSTGVNFPAFYDKQWVASDASVRSPFKDRTYMCYTLFDSPVGTSKIFVKRIQNPLDAGNGVLLATTGQVSTNIAQGCNVDVGPDGQVAVAWYQAFPGDAATTARIMLSRSYDGGATWTAPITVKTFLKMTSCAVGFFGCLTGTAGPFRTNSFPDIEWDRLGGLHITWTAKVSGDVEVVYTRTLFCDTPAGTCAFGPRVVVNNDPTNRDQFHPNIITSDEVSASNQRGTVIIVASDKREDAANLSWRPWSYHCHIDATACDAAADFSVDPQTAVSFGLFSNTGSFIGEYNGLTSGNGITTATSRHAYAIWYDAVGSPDLFTDRTTT